MNMFPARELCEIRLVTCEASLTIQCTQEKQAWENQQNRICQLKVVAIETEFNIFHDKYEQVTLSLRSFTYEHKMWTTRL